MAKKPKNKRRSCVDGAGKSTVRITYLCLGIAKTPAIRPGSDTRKLYDTAYSDTAMIVATPLSPVEEV